MATATKIRKSQSVMVVYLVLVLLCANLNRVRCFNSIQSGDWGNSNSTATATAKEYINDDEEEFLMESEVSRRILAVTKPGKGIGYGGLKGGQVICSSPDRYAKCLPTYNDPKRPCGFENRCNRNT